MVIKDDICDLYGYQRWYLWLKLVLKLKLVTEIITEDDICDWQPLQITFLTDSYWRWHLWLTATKDDILTDSYWRWHLWLTATEDDICDWYSYWRWHLWLTATEDDICDWQLLKMTFVTDSCWRWLFDWQLLKMTFVTDNYWRWHLWLIQLLKMTFVPKMSTEDDICDWCSYWRWHLWLTRLLRMTLWLA